MISIRTLGLAYLEENKLEEAEAEFLKLVDLDPTEVLGYANLGLVYLRMGKYQEAEEWLLKAVKMDPKDPDIRMILAKVYEMSNHTAKSIDELEKAIRFSPGHVKSLYNLSELYAASADDESLKNRHKYTDALVESAPANIVPRLNLIEILIREGQSDKALEQLEAMHRLFPEFPKEAIEHYDKTITALQLQDLDQAAVSFMIFHNYLKVTAPYQAGIMDLKGPGGSLIGFPVITFDQQQGPARYMDWRTALEAINFTDITSSAGLDTINTGPARTHITAGDYDGDGNSDLYIGRLDGQSGSYRHFLLKNELGKFHDVAGEAGLKHQGIESSAKFGDYNNDGFLDLFILREGSNILYQNTGEGTFVNVTATARVGNGSAGNISQFFDFDHDGDLDLFIAAVDSNLLYRNNADGTFLEQAAQSGLSGGSLNSTDAAFGDFDEDGDIDLFVVNSDGPDALYANQRLGVFRNITGGSGLVTDSESGTVTAGDYNNDGFLDLFVTSPVPGQCRLYSNLGDGSFETDRKSAELGQTLQGIRVQDASFLDFDNDGFLDLLVAGKAVGSGSEKGVSVFHNDGTGIFYIVPDILPEDLISGRQIQTMDFNDDGDMDVVIAGMDGSVRLLRNDGGNKNHYVKMKLVGLRTGSAKNNYYGIGAKVEIRAGNLYQSKVVTEPLVHFGLGPRSKADVIRILWTNGVPQNIFYPGTDQDLVEEQILKGSCPFLYTWNGKEYVFAKDIMWRSALGMPLGIMGESTEYANPDASVDYIKIPGELLKPKNGKYTVQVTGELWETIYFDKVALVVLDHHDSVDVFVDERFLPPPVPGYRVYPVRLKLLPVSARNRNGVNLLPLIAEKDDKYVSDLRPGKYQGLTEMTELILDLGEINPSNDLILFLNGWIFPTDASINAAISQSEALTVIPPCIQAVNGRGEWVTIVDNLSFPMGKDKTIVADLSGKIPASDPRIRILTNMEIYWDQIFYSNDHPDLPIRTHTLNPSSADLHYRGFSATFRKGGRYGPHWFDYSAVTTGQQWRDLLGHYTRYGDVLPLLTEADDKYIIKNAGDETTIAFDAAGLPELPRGWKRDFLIHSIGWVKDGDLNTATGKTVGPLPFHGMTRYPYGPDESYPSDNDHQKYLEEYNTREVTTADFRNAVNR